MSADTEIPSRTMVVGPKAYAVFVRYARRDMINGRPVREALTLLFNAGFRGRDLDLTYDMHGSVKL